MALVNEVVLRRLVLMGLLVVDVFVVVGPLGREATLVLASIKAFVSRARRAESYD